MARFKKEKAGGVPAISTASLPDIVFMLLFFFMVTTVMRETSLKITVTTPKATETAKLENKSEVSYIYIGKPVRAMQSTFGTEPRIQLNDEIADLDDIPQFIEAERTEKTQNLTTSLKVDRATEMGIVTDVKQELRKIGAYKINYSAGKIDDIFGDNN